MKKRILSGIIIGILFISSILFYRNLFNILMFFVAFLMLLEWYKMTEKSALFCLLGLIIIPLPIGSIFFISSIDKYGWILLAYFCVIWVVDIMAMVGGKLIGGPQLAPILSPKKTISGLVVGTISASLVPLILGLLPSYNVTYILPHSTPILCLLCFLTATIAQASDLFISFFKRRFGLKDSGNIIPGHGGVLDRFDSIVLTAPLVALYLHSIP
jgi:phosphatidate cytidylyltransferase